MMSGWQNLLARAIDDRFDQMIALRRHLHENPEVSGEEYETSLHIYQILDTVGLTVRLGPDGRGVIVDFATNGNGESGGLFALRADIDALYIQDEKQVPYASKRDGVMHACGHDAHAALVCGALLAILDLSKQGQLPCQPRLRGVFQPAEESCEGAVQMIEAGALDGVGAILAAHVDPTRRIGRIGLRPGVLMANCEDMRITITGRGGHAARPHEARDPITAAAQLINWLYLQIPRSTDSQEAVVITIGQIQGGHTPNVIPERVELRGTLRTLDRGVRERTMEQVRQLAAAVAMGSHTKIDVEFGVGAESVYNDPQLIDLVGRTVVDVLGDEGVESIPRPSMGSEDFAFYSARTAGAMIRLGCVSDRGGGPLLHTPQFDIDEEALRIGALVLAHTAIRWLEAAATKAADADTPADHAT